MPSNQRLKTRVRRHRSDDDDAQLQGPEGKDWDRSSSQESHGEDSQRWEEECCQWKATGQCSRGDSCSFSHGSKRGQKAQSPSPAPKAKTRFDGRKPSKGVGPRGKSPSGRKGQRACTNFLKGTTCTNSSCNYWHPPEGQIDISVSGCKFGDQCLFRHTEADGEPSKKPKKSGGKEQLPCEAVNTTGLRVPRYRSSEEVCSTENW